MSPGPKKTALEARVKELKDSHEAYKQQVASACVVSNRVYISSIADRNRKSGKLGIGYGGDGKKIGPEYAFGLSIAEKIDGPILLIKNSWGVRGNLKGHHYMTRNYLALKTTCLTVHRDGLMPATRETFEDRR